MFATCFLDRSIGDGDTAGLTAEPEVSHVALSAADEFLVLASDGLWDQVSLLPRFATKCQRDHFLLPYTVAFFIASCYRLISFLLGELFLTWKPKAFSTG